MSYDLQLAFNCPHLAVDERVSLATDKKTILTKRLVSSAGLIKVKINGLVIPPQGLKTPARLRSIKKGSYYFKGGESVTISNTTASATLSFPKGLLSASAFAEKVRLEAGSVCSAEVKDGYVTLSDVVSLGKGSRLKITGSGVEVLGFALEPRAQGEYAYPAWTLISAETNPESGEVYGRRVYFLEPIRNDNLLIKVTYSMISERCLRCQGLQVENDYRYGEGGGLRKLTDENLLQQRCLKILLTDRGSNVFHNWYGSSLQSRLGSKAVGAVASALRVDVERALETLRNTQDQQAEYQQMSAKERLAEVESVLVSPLENDPTAFIIDVVVRNASNESVNITAIYTSPGVTAYLNDSLVFGG